MIDPISFSISIGAILISALTHIKFSKCSVKGFEIETRPLNQESDDKKCVK